MTPAFQLFTRAEFVPAAIGAATAIATRALFDFVEARRNRATNRIDVALLVVKLYHDHQAEILRLIEKRKTEKGPIVSPELARLNGSIMEVQLKVWKAFPETKIRAAFSRLLTRMKHAEEVHLADGVLTTELSKLSIEWANTQYEEIAKQIADRAKLPRTARGRITWVRFGIVTEEDKRLLSFEDWPPPWQFGVIFTDVIGHLTDEEKQKATESMRRRFGHLRCNVHNRPVQIRMLREKRLGTVTCCAEFHDVVTRLMSDEAKKKSSQAISPATGRQVQ